MRETFVKKLEDIGAKDKDLTIFTGDLGFKLFDNFKIKYPDRFYNIGVAGSNMVSLAAGMALCGKNVYCYSIIPFLVMRTYEQIRIGIAYHNLNVKLIGVGGGFTYGLEGFTHFALEDLALMRSLPNMTVVVPADIYEAEYFSIISSRHSGPMYIRLGKAGDPKIHNEIPKIEIGKALEINKGKDVAIFAIGNMVFVAKQVVSMLKNKGINATLINMHTLKPLDIEAIKNIASNHSAIFSVEEHNIEGGLGSAIAEVLSEKSFGGVFKRFGIFYKPLEYIGKQDYLREKYGLTPDKIYNEILGKIHEIM